VLTSTRHEHLYKKIEKNVIRTDTLPKPSGLKKFLQGAQVILCTLSMVSSPKTHDLSRIVPITNVVIDEASQIEISQYVPLFNSFGHTLRKLCFIGDDKQCGRISFHFALSFPYFFPVPPHGQDDLKNLQSIFERAHLKESAVFLDIQCKNCSPLVTNLLTYSRTQRPYAPSDWGFYISTSLQQRAQIKPRPSYKVEDHRVPFR